MSVLLDAPMRKRPRLRVATAAAIAAATDPDAAISMAVVIALTGMSQTTIRRLVKEGAFPAPSNMSTRVVRWRAGDVRDWLRAHRPHFIMPLAATP